MIEMGKKYRTRDGWPARVICVDAKTPRPVIAIAEDPRDPSDDFVIRTTMEGRFNDSNKSGYDLIEVGPYDDFKIDEPVMVREGVRRWIRRYFAGVAPDGRATTWNSGATSWTTDSHMPWDECRRPTPEEMK
jgi:hypothetical protein